MSLGDIIWSAIGAAFLLLVLVTTYLRATLPTLNAIIRAFLHSWLGRSLLLCGWAEVGWHLFCQRP
ncbi:MAG: hypothetical protein ACYDHP_00755 [Ferrimicrobium sp.]